MSSQNNSSSTSPTMKMNFTVVIVPGAWPLVSFFEPLMQAFEARNHPAVCELPGSYPPYDASNPPAVNPDSEFLRHSVLEPVVNSGADVVVFTHSYGGVYGPESLQGLSKRERQSKGLKGGIVATVMNAAFVAPKGTTALGAMGIDPNNLPPFIDYDVPSGLVGIKKEYAKELLFNDLPPEEADRLADMLPKQSYACFSTPTQYDPYSDPNFAERIGFIYTEADMIFPYEAQKMSVAAAGIEYTYLLEKSSHSPHLEQPQNLADLVIDMVHNITKKNCN